MPHTPLIASCVEDRVASAHDTSIVPLWSITKTCLAAGALVLVAGGRLDLERPLAGHRFTLRQLLQHTSGLACYTDMAAYEAAAQAEAGADGDD